MTEDTAPAPLTFEERKTIAYRVARQIYTAECAIETAYRESALLAAELAAARFDGRIPTTTDQHIFDHATGIMGSLTEARGRAIDLHRRAEAIGRRLQMDMLPPNTPKPDQAVKQPSLQTVEPGARITG